MKISRKINWVSSKDINCLPLIKQLENQLQAFYSKNPNYYSSINFTETNWINQNQKGYLAIIVEAKKATSICEVGCGGANILKYYPELISKYSGCDFSKDLMTANKQQYNAANFIEINTPNLLPFQDNMFDLVFSTFVLEHSTNPSLLLKECTRILKPSGKLIILCPDFLNRGKLTSQRAGFSEGTSLHKLKQGKYLDACITLWDNRIKIPFYCFFSKIQAKKKPRFLINLNPVLFEDSFIPDVDAVYATYKDEIVCELSTQFSLEQNSAEINEYEKQHHLIFLSFTLK